MLSIKSSYLKNKSTAKIIKNEILKKMVGIRIKFLTFYSSQKFTLDSKFVTWFIFILVDKKLKCLEIKFIQVFLFFTYRFNFA